MKPRSMTREEALAVLGVLGRAGSPLPVIPWDHVNTESGNLIRLGRAAFHATPSSSPVWNLIADALTTLGIRPSAVLPSPALPPEPAPAAADTRGVPPTRTFVFAPDRDRALHACALYGVPALARSTVLIYPAAAARIQGYSIRPTARVVWAAPWTGIDDLPADFRAEIAPAFVTLAADAYARLTNGGTR